MEKTLELVWVGPNVGWQMVSENHQGRVNSVSLVDGDPKIAPACQLCQGKAQKKNNDFCQHFCLGESCPSSSGPNARQFSFSQFVPGAFSAAAPALSLEGTGPNKSEWAL